MKKLIFIALFAAVFLSGCLYKTDLSYKIIVDIIGVDVNEDEVNLYFYPFDTDNFSVIQSTGETIEQALQNLEIKNNKMVFTKQASSLILSQQTAKTNFLEVLKHFKDTKKYDINMVTYITDNLYNVMYSDSIKNINSTKANKLINDYDVENISFNVKLIDIFKSINKKENFYIPKIKYENSDTKIEGGSYFINNEYYSYVSDTDILNLNILNEKLQNTYLTYDGESIYLNYLNISSYENSITLNIDAEVKSKDINVFIQNFKKSLFETIKNTRFYLDSGKNIKDIEVYINKKLYQ